MINPVFRWVTMFLIYNIYMYICDRITTTIRRSRRSEICEDGSCGIIEGCFKKQKKKKQKEQKEHLFALSQTTTAIKKMIYHFHSFAMTSCYIIHTHTKQSRFKVENKAGKGIKKVAKLLESEQFSG